jgi:hypothetical protein
MTPKLFQNFFSLYQMKIFSDKNIYLQVISGAPHLFIFFENKKNKLMTPKPFQYFFLAFQSV